MKQESTIIELPEPKKIVFKTVELYLNEMREDEVYAETIYSAISTGTELSAYKGEKPIRPVSNPYPRVVGYCNVAEVKEVGSTVSLYTVGDYILTFQSHRTSFICKESDVILKIPRNGVSLQHAATTFLYHLGYETFLKSNFKPGFNVAVIGLGTLGLATVNIASLIGCKIFSFSNYPDNLKLAKKFGSHQSYLKNEEGIQKSIYELTYGTGIDIVITTSNTWDDWKLALELARDEGIIGVIGFPGRGQGLPDFNPLEPQYLYHKKLTVVYSGYMPDYLIPAKDIRFTRKRNCQFILDQIIDNKLFPEKLIHKEYRWKDIEIAYKDMLERKQSVYTSILNWKK
ncbi:zinc-dependent alcohol dehydrogenase [Leptospira santarosai]|uniref:zinc-dependent alcohol dehydrogenase n=1 Tax=Leptospira santarosai TaxID=28183 RepID=UPI00095E331F|nr:zinc-binding alcohol dehydrogenase [Leptospira santarosai]ASV10834.1 zinc-binding dehydrogenase [Leptospira santarosai]MBW9232613.1 zinc-binding alcohol dehydrogenase [Leptospira santarosai]MDI7174366.1 zinc-binding alcohol dehydrogenase [Leptospira santarosai]MDI7193699.1 zinc-binding alcohol dehydrogenase [Leptospira santarosai]MDO6382046.1 zinc-binding alcohol dehydrogenase [Leptospira santarosai]